MTHIISCTKEEESGFCTWWCREKDEHSAEFFHECVRVKTKLQAKANSVRDLFEEYGVSVILKDMSVDDGKMYIKGGICIQFHGAHTNKIVGVRQASLSVSFMSDDSLAETMNHCRDNRDSVVKQLNALVCNGLCELAEFAASLENILFSDHVGFVGRMMSDDMFTAILMHAKDDGLSKKYAVAKERCFNDAVGKFVHGIY
jgi:hypothetical protein